jgi:hypothetical protein
MSVASGMTDLGAISGFPTFTAVVGLSSGDSQLVALMLPRCQVYHLLAAAVCKTPIFEMNPTASRRTNGRTTNLGNIGPFGMTRSSKSNAMLVAD